MSKVLLNLNNYWNNEELKQKNLPALKKMLNKPREMNDGDAIDFITEKLKNK